MRVKTMNKSSKVHATMTSSQFRSLREYKLEMKIMAKVLRSIDQRIDAEFPEGIQPEPEGE